MLCSDSAHIHVDEAGSPERLAGTKVIALPTPDGKLRPEQLDEHLAWLGDEHHPQPKVLSITQSTEWGTLYTADEIGALCDAAHRAGMVVHLDGARIANATAALGGDLRAFTIEAGVDVISFGGTKNGMMYGECVVFCRPELGDHAKFVRKQLAQLPSKVTVHLGAIARAARRRSLAPPRRVTPTRMARRTRYGGRGDSTASSSCRSRS